MLDRTFIEKLLITNGVDPSGPDEAIKSVLISAKWHKDDVETAIMVLREDELTHKQRVDSLEKIFRSDERLKPETISSMLGISVDIPSTSVSANGKRDGGVFSMLLFSFIFSALLVLSAMWYLNVGPFYGDF